ncbi:MAG: hypothetical protein AAGF47_02430 [Planctomycetota bacterium]
MAALQPIQADPQADPDGTPVELADAAQPPASADQWLPSILMAAAVVLLVIVVLGKTRKLAAARAKQPDYTPAERLESIRAQAQAEGSIEGRVAHAADRIRELTAVLDTRIAYLEALIVQADDRIEAMGRPATSEPPSRTEPTVSASAATGTAAGAGAGSSVSSQKQDIYTLADQGLTPSEIATRLGQHAGKIELILALRRA